MLTYIVINIIFHHGICAHINIIIFLCLETKYSAPYILCPANISGEIVTTKIICCKIIFIVKFIIVMIVDLLLITFIPAISMFLPNLIMK